MSTRHKHPEGALCAAGGFYPPLQSDGEAAAIQQAALLRGLRVDILVDPCRSICKNIPPGSQGVLTFSVYEPVPGQYRTGRVREPTNWYRVRSSIKNKFTNEGLDFSNTRWYSVFSTQRE